MYEYTGKVLNVVDGDTIDVAIDVGFTLTTTHRLRLLGINCPEVHGESRAAGLAASAYVRSELLGRTIRLRTEKSDDFGRYLARIYVGDVDFNQSLVDKGYAVPYMVGKPQAAG